MTALLNHRDYDQGSSPEPRREPERHESVAVLLRRARKEHGQDVRSVAQVLRIRQAYIEALESGQFERLPGMAYALGFLRTYAEYLGLDPIYVVDRYKIEVQGAERRTELIFPEPVNEGRIPGGALILISLVFVAVAYGGWIYLSNQGRSVADLIPAMPDQLQALIDSEPTPTTTGMPTATGTPAVEAPLVPSPAAQTASVEAAPVVAPLPQPSPAESGAPVAETAPPPPATADQAEPATAAATIEDVVRDVPNVATERAAPAEPVAEARPSPVEPRRAAPAADVASVEPLVSPAPSAADAEDPVRVQDEEPARVEPVQEADRTVIIPSPPAAPSDFGMPGERRPRVYGETTAAPRIVLRATQDSWVQVRDRQNALLLTRVLRAGDSYRVPDQEGLTLLTGNAGGIAVEIDGQTLPPLGPVGAVRRNIPLEPDRLLNGDTSRR